MSTLAEMMSVEPSPSLPGTYTSLAYPDRWGNTANIAYGGCAIATAIAAACTSVPAEYRLYSAQGNFLGPALVDRKLHARVETVRDTRTFATRIARAFQLLDDGRTERACLLVVADFHLPERAEVLRYSEPPRAQYTDLAGSWDLGQWLAGLVERGTIMPTHAEQFRAGQALGDRMFERRYTPEGIMAQNLSGFAKHAVTTQDHLPIYEKTTGSWVRTVAPLAVHGAQMAAVGFLLDAALSFTPLSHNHMALTDAGACSSLEFSLRVFANDVDVRQWHLHELRTVAGGVGRTFSKGTLHDQRGNLVASMSEQSILRPKPPKKEKM